MSRFAPVVPPSIARFMQGQSREHDILGGYHLLLAHDVLAHPDEYKSIYREQVRERYGSSSWIILDNSVVELGKALPIDEIIAAADIVEPDCIVVPDVMGDFYETRKVAAEFCRAYSKKMYSRSRDDLVVPLMGVIQGTTLEDCLETACHYYALPLVEMVGIPRVAARHIGSRMPIVQGIVGRNQDLFKSVHLLGFSDDVLDDVACARVDGISGIDSAVPVRAALRGQELRIEREEDYGKRGDFWEKTLQDYNARSTELIGDNVAAMRRWIGDKN